MSTVQTKAAIIPNRYNLFSATADVSPNYIHPTDVAEYVGFKWNQEVDAVVRPIVVKLLDNTKTHTGDQITQVVDQLKGLVTDGVLAVIGGELQTVTGVIAACHIDSTTDMNGTVHTPS